MRLNNEQIDGLQRIIDGDDGVRPVMFPRRIFQHNHTPEAARDRIAARRAAHEEQP